jgi:hypothetical protein
MTGLIERKEAPKPVSWDKNGVVEREDGEVFGGFRP